MTRLSRQFIAARILEPMLVPISRSRVTFDVYCTVQFTGTMRFSDEVVKRLVPLFLLGQFGPYSTSHSNAACSSLLLKGIVASCMTGRNFSQDGNSGKHATFRRLSICRQDKTQNADTLQTTTNHNAYYGL